MPYMTINPATGELLATYDDISDALLEAKLAAAHRALKPTGAAVRSATGHASCRARRRCCGKRRSNTLAI